MNEALLYYIWKFRQYDPLAVETTDKQKIQVINPGTQNMDSGPDFINARIRIGEQLWVGNVEVHIKADDWNKHGHNSDEAFNNTILHVVYDYPDKKTVAQNGNVVPVLCLKDYTNSSLLHRYKELADSKDWIPCKNKIGEIDGIIWKTVFDRLSAERLESKVESIEEMLNHSGHDWENVAFQLTARYLGGSVNKEPFTLLAKSLPVKVWAKHSDDLFQIEALVFGQAGFLNEAFEDEYANQLNKEYKYLKRLHNLQPLPSSLWKFLRLRPVSFPTLRMAQLSALMHKTVKFMSFFKEQGNLKEFFRIEVSDYWKSHYRFDKNSDNVKWHVGESTIDVITINAIAPLLFTYGRYYGQEEFCEKAIEILQNTKPELNAVMKQWSMLNVKAESAYDTQALLQLKTNYCSKFQCLDCKIGATLLR